MINEDESEYDTQMSEDDQHTNTLISKPGKDDTVKSLMRDFEVRMQCYCNQNLST